MAKAKEDKDLAEAVVVSAEREDLKEYPGRTLGVVAVVLAFFTQIPALIMGIIAWVWSHQAGHNNVPAKVAVAVSAALLVIIALAIVGWFALLSSLGGDFGNGFGYDMRHGYNMRGI
jgi:hypothetical protein